MATKPAPLNTFLQQPAKPAAKPEPIEPESAQEVLRQKIFRLTPAQDRALKKFCADSDMTMQDVILEGINRVLTARGLPTI